jgi:glycerol kinase
VVLGAIADTTGLTIRPADDPETTLRGAAMLAVSSPAVELADLPPVAYRCEIDPRIDDDARHARRTRWRAAIEAARTLRART